jgi:hypothetical protein
MEPISTYEQRYAGVTRKFQLYPDHIAVHGRRLGSSFDQKFEFSALNPQFDRARVRAPLFYGGFILLAIAAIGFIILTLDHGLVVETLSVIGAIAVAGAVSVALRPRPIDVFMFKNRNGEYLFEIAGVGRDAERVGEFVALVGGQMGKNLRP